MPSIDYAALRGQVSICQILNVIAYQPSSRRGDQWRGPCPLPGHPPAQKHDRAFTVHVQRNIYYCHRCRSGGNQLDLWVALSRHELHEAVIDLCHKLQLDLDQFLLNRKPNNTRHRSTTPATDGPH